jgi:hypothetical protein
MQEKGIVRIFVFFVANKISVSPCLRVSVSPCLRDSVVKYLVRNPD